MQTSTEKWENNLQRERPADRMSDMVHRIRNTRHNRWLPGQKIIKSAVWDKNDQDIPSLIESRPKVQELYSDDKNERDYIKNFAFAIQKCGLELVEE